MWCCYADQELKIVGINFELSLFHGGFYVTIHKTTELKNSNSFKRYCGLHVNYRTWELKSIRKILWIMYDYPQNYRTWELEEIESCVNCGIVELYSTISRIFKLNSIWKLMWVVDHINGAWDPNFAWDPKKL